MEIEQIRPDQDLIELAKEILKQNKSILEITRLLVSVAMPRTLYKSNNPEELKKAKEEFLK